MSFPLFFSASSMRPQNLSHGVAVAFPAVCVRGLDHPGANQYSGAEPQFAVGAGRYAADHFWRMRGGGADCVCSRAWRGRDAAAVSPRVQQAMAWAGALVELAGLADLFKARRRP